MLEKWHNFWCQYPVCGELNKGWKTSLLYHFISYIVIQCDSYQSCQWKNLDGGALLCYSTLGQRSLRWTNDWLFKDQPCQVHSKPTALLGWNFRPTHHKLLWQSCSDATIFQHQSGDFNWPWSTLRPGQAELLSLYSQSQNDSDLFRNIACNPSPMNVESYNLKHNFLSQVIYCKYSRFKL